MSKRQCIIFSLPGAKSTAPSVTYTPGRSESTNMLHYFEEMYAWFESELVPVTTVEMHAKMVELAGEDEVYSIKHMTRKIEKQYGGDIVISKQDGKPSLVCFRNVADYIIAKSFKDKEIQKLSECERIMQTAANLIKSDIKTAQFASDYYPSKHDIKNCDDSLPPTLRFFMKALVSNEVKQASIGQAIIKAVKPRSYIPPLLFGLGVELDNLFASKWLINELSHLGFSISYEEITRYKHSVIASEEEGIENLLNGKFTQWVGDNVDHNVRTIDGKNTFHGMGIIAVGTRTREQEPSESARIPRLRSLLKAKNITELKNFSIKWYEPDEVCGLSKIILKPVMQLTQPFSLSSSSGIDILWQSSLLFSKEENRPSWNGFMQEHSHGEHNPESEIFMLPIINMSASDENCIYSTLLFILDQAQALRIDTPCVTFDQPLWIKALEIVVSMKLNIVVRLGGFHTMMSFLGSIGCLMEGSGLERLLEAVYAKNTVPHIMSGKAVSRAVRAHLLVESALTCVLLEKCTSWKDNENALHLVFNNLKQGKLSIDEVNNDVDVIKLQIEFETGKVDISKQSRTAKLWIQYLDYIATLKMYIKAERIGNWAMHLESTRKMLNLFAGTGHVNYAKSARLYLQIMFNLQDDHPWLFEQFCNGFHSIRRTDRFWAGLWSDLVIEQFMMRSIKNRGGLTRGRGMVESTRDLWVGTMHKCGDVHHTMESVTRQRHQSSEQHVEMSTTRRQRDNSDIKLLIDLLQQFDPFLDDSRLRCITTGVAAGEDDIINCDEVETIGA